MEKKTWRQQETERTAHKLRMEELRKKGWISTGDAPYVIAQQIPGAKSNIIDTHFRLFFESALDKQNQEYERANFETVGTRKTFISPDLFSKIKEEAESFYYKRIR